MKYLILGLLLSGCGATRTGYMVFVKEEDSTLINLQGTVCSESGYQLDQGGKRLITFYGNCDIHKLRTLKEYELKQWAEPKK